MAQHIVAFSSTPRRRGNSDILTDHVLKGVEMSGGSFEKIRLSDLSISYCTACDACQKAPDARCVINDDANAALDKLREADGLVLASPVYFASVCGQMKTFLDRWYSLFNRDSYDLLQGRKAVTVLTYGDPDPVASGVMNAVRMLQDAFGFLGIESRGCLHASCLGPAEIEQNAAVLEAAVALGSKLCDD